VTRSFTAPQNASRAAAHVSHVDGSGVVTNMSGSLDSIETVSKAVTIPALAVPAIAFTLSVTV
jgi:hypothetical protein